MLAEMLGRTLEIGRTLTPSAGAVRGGGGSVVGSLLLAAAAAAQVTHGWWGLEHRSGAGAVTDEGFKVATDVHSDGLGDHPYTYVAGYVTEASGATRLAVYRYDALELGPFGQSKWQQPADKVFFFPPLTTTAVGDNRATAITIDTDADTIYVAGYTRYKADLTVDTAANYVVCKLDFDLLGELITWPNTGAGAGVRIFDPSPGQDDKAVGVAVYVPTDEVFVTGSSKKACGGESPPVAHDIVTIRLTSLGALSAAWPTVGAQPQGVRRWSRPNVCGDDTPVGVGVASINDVEGGDAGIWCFVGGTTATATTSANNFIALAYDGNAIVAGSANNTFWEREHDGGLDDVCTAMAVQVQDGGEVGYVFLTGYSVRSGGGAMMMSPTPADTDYASVLWDDNGVALWAHSGNPAHRYANGPGGGSGNDDYAAGCAINWTGAQYTSVPYFWTTGKMRHGVNFDAGTVVYDDGGVVKCTDLFEWVPGLDLDDQAAAIAAGGFGLTYLAGLTQAVAGNYDAFVYRLDIPSSGSICTRPWAMKYPEASTGGFEAARGVGFGFGDVFFTGQAPNPTFGQDLFSMRVDQP